MLHVYAEAGHQDAVVGAGGLRTWHLNEWHYGGLTGLNEAETAAKHGEEQVKVWRRSYDIPPPSMEPEHEFYASISQVNITQSLEHTE